MNIANKKIYDVCVIGSGAAGGFMVKELTAAGACLRYARRLSQLPDGDFVAESPRLRCSETIAQKRLAKIGIKLIPVRSARHIAELRRRGEL